MHYFNGAFARTAENEHKMRENLKSRFHCTFINWGTKWTYEVHMSLQGVYTMLWDHCNIREQVSMLTSVPRCYIWFLFCINFRISNKRTMQSNYQMLSDHNSFCGACMTWVICILFRSVFPFRKIDIMTQS
jgi:hypothetical protein